MHFTLCDDSRNRRQADLSGYPGLERSCHSFRRPFQTSRHLYPRLVLAGARTIKDCMNFESRVWDCDGGDSEEVRGLHLGNRRGNSKKGGGGPKVIIFLYVPQSSIRGVEKARQFYKRCKRFLTSCFIFLRSSSLGLPLISPILPFVLLASEP